MLAVVGVPAAIFPGFVAQAEEEMEEVIVSGLRGKPRTATDSAVPVDVFNADVIDSVSHTDMDDIMQTLVPSYNVSRQPISDGATFIRPASLRDLPSHHTLVLINGKRRHRAALVSIGGSGTQGPDLATVPAIALQSIEVLRDGASSQYGSDAIAGVINLNLKENSEGGSINVNSGGFSEGDGDQITVQGNVGLPLGDEGFLSISAEFSDQEFTERAEQYCESWFCVDLNNPRFDPTAGYADFVLGRTSPDARLNALQTAFPAGVPAASVEGENVMPWGTPNSEATRVFYNAAIPIDGVGEVYSFGNFSDSESDGSFFYRYPGNGTIEDLRLEDGSLYTPLEIFPGGFTPRFEGEVSDVSFLFGLRGETSNALSWDVSARYGRSEVDYRLFNTINPSLGPNTPTDFKPGELANEEVQLQADLFMDVEMGGVDAVFAFGFSYLDETYEVNESSQPESYEPGPFAVADPFSFCNDDGTATAAGAAVIANGSTLNCADDDDPVYTAVGVGSNGFPGFSPAFSDDYERDSYAVYADLSSDVTDQLFLQAALRYEDYSDFGSETVGKLAGLYRLDDTWAFRASVGTGFRAPTPGQQGTTNVSTRLPNGFPVATGLFPASGAVAQALGAQPLEAETSTNLTLGVTAIFGELSLTVDYYQIDIDDRFYSITTRSVSTDPTAGAAYNNFLALDGAGVAGANTIGGVFYFTNAFDSSSEGVDIVATLPVDWDNGQVTTFTASMNYNESSVESDASAFLGVEEIFDFENQAPNFRGVFTAAHQINSKASITGRLSYYGESEDSDDSGDTFTGFQTFDPVLFFDLEGTYQFTDMLSLSGGGRNVFDEYPVEIDRTVNDNDYCCGRQYASTSFVPWQGRYYFVSLRADF
jgi:iron complex outermembrane receptor protein